ncbi:hypothetical protein HK098_002419 [Nowakowskiella sp. JEL0407]|nr:hypothetical protein HK098_002419 [Nowakowskiella sp. JEL0407]
MAFLSCQKTQLFENIGYLRIAYSHDIVHLDAKTQFYIEAMCHALRTDVEIHRKYLDEAMNIAAHLPDVEMLGRVLVIVGGSMCSVPNMRVSFVDCYCKCLSPNLKRLIAKVMNVLAEEKWKDYDAQVSEFKWRVSSADVEIVGFNLGKWLDQKRFEKIRYVSAKKFDRRGFLRRK